MIPTGNSIGTELGDDFDLQSTSLTYRFDPKSGLISGKIDGIEAVKQAVFKILQTERFQYLAYDSDYGIEMISLLGQDRRIYRSELKRRIEEALLQDERIDAVEDMEVSFQENAVLARFTVVTPIGSFQASQEVI
ncbi:DUF2634 domain-containing protein [Cohnella lupini]|uniref:Uncharacterized protein DUF2634 n=1 Tax=Cohnella lupini TaxID=1294267 RepID=A0A3D9IU83_9BACL|nr:DUF2634 domain-containing protein [Cohnella lupini]RED64676.1 uncharacterized protein DUF2634 [Cohnella lupini]